MAIDPPVLLIGLGHRYRSDDGFGPKAIYALKKVYGDTYETLTHSGDPADLMDVWCERDVVILDAMAAPNEEVGTISLFSPLHGEVFRRSAATSSHAMSLADALSLGQLLGKLPKSLLVVGVVAEEFGPGDQLSLPMERAIEKVVMMLPSWIIQRPKEGTMHESTLMHGFMRQLQHLAKEHQAARITSLSVKVGALTHFSKEHFLEHFVHEAQGTLAEGAHVTVELLEDINDPHAQDILLDEFTITTDTHSKS